MNDQKHLLSTTLSQKTVYNGLIIDVAHMQVRLPIDLCFVTPETVWVESARMDYAFVDAGNSVYASDHNAVIFELKLKTLQICAVGIVYCQVIALWHC